MACHAFYFRKRNKESNFLLPKISITIISPKEILLSLKGSSQRAESKEGENSSASKKYQLCSMNYGSNETKYSNHARVSLQKKDLFFRQVYFRKRNKALLVSGREVTKDECDWLEESQTMSGGESDS
ncbi:hypothetical protein TorRG33x02_353810, partial [Trema orientale]